ncbi:MAG: PH domain-containing protein [Sphingosinicella sp.]
MEETKDSYRSSLSGWLRGTLAGLGTILLLVGGLAGLAPLLGLAVPPWMISALALTGIALLIILVKWFDTLEAKYQVTEERLILRRGIFFKNVDEIELYRVKDLRLDFTLLNQWADIGTITVSSSDETTRGGDLVIKHIPKAEQRREDLRRLVDQARQRRGVREVDMVHETAP